jgi:2-haloacid dehalogenase
MAIRAVIFDAYGTLFDVYSIGALAEDFFPGQGAALVALWRERQIEYTRLRSMSARYKPFDEVTRDALVFCCRRLGIALTDARRDALMAQYNALAPFPENHAVLKSLRQMGLQTAILSNGNPPMLEAVVAAAGMTDLLDHLLSVDSVKVFKTAPQAYQLGPDRLGCRLDEIVFVSSNCWDVCGATWFGYTTFWVNRAGAPLEELDVVPSGQGTDLDDLLSFVHQQERV